MSKPLVIVESPAKAKTIAKFLGSDFDVRASVGHIADLPSKGLSVDVDNGFSNPGIAAERLPNSRTHSIRRLYRGAKYCLNLGSTKP